MNPIQNVTTDDGGSVATNNPEGSLSGNNEDQNDNGGVDTDSDTESTEGYEAVRRRAIQEIMQDTSISEEDRRLRIQSFMDGRSTNATVATPNASREVPSATSHPTPSSLGPACVHYERVCQIVAPCCNRVFGCRLCHDEEMSDVVGASHPPLDRFSVNEVICISCSTRQEVS